MRMVVAAAVSLLTVSVANADWPARVFAPYAYLPPDAPFSIDKYRQVTGQKYCVLAFVITGKDGQPAWDGTAPAADGRFYSAEIAKFRAAGGDVAVSFGGEAGTELAISAADVPTLVKQYESVIDAYHLKRVDFDVEGKALDDIASVKRRNLALVRLQQERPGLFVQFTLPVWIDGLAANGLALLKDAAAAGVKVSAVNLMTMDYGTNRPKKTESELAISGVLGTKSQLDAMQPSLGKHCDLWICPMIGVSDVKGEKFTLEDAKKVRQFAESHPFVAGLTFWSANRDHPGAGGNGLSVPANAYTKAFAEFTGNR